MTAEDALSEREKRWHAYLEGVAGGNGESLAALYDEASAMLYGLALRILGNAADAEDVLLEVFEQIWRSARARSGAWRWFTVLTHSRAVDRLRARASKEKREELRRFDDWEISSREPSPDEASMFRQAADTHPSILKCAAARAERGARAGVFFGAHACRDRRYAAGSTG